LPSLPRCNAKRKHSIILSAGDRPARTARRIRTAVSGRYCNSGLGWCHHDTPGDPEGSEPAGKRKDMCSASQPCNSCEICSADLEVENFCSIAEFVGTGQIKESGTGGSDGGNSSDVPGTDVGPSKKGGCIASITLKSIPCHRMHRAGFKRRVICLGTVCATPDHGVTYRGRLISLLTLVREADLPYTASYAEVNNCAPHTWDDSLITVTLDGEVVSFTAFSGLGLRCQRVYRALGIISH
jgi:hypothetical protein